MTGKELAIVRGALESAHTMWHQCRLRDAERGLKKGQPCDTCLQVVQAAVEDIDAACKRLKE